MNCPTLHYAVHGLPLRASANADSLLAPLESMLRAFRSQGADGGFELLFRSGAFDSDVPADFKLFWRGPLTDGPTMSYYTAPQMRVIVLEGLGRADLDLARRRLAVAVAPGKEALAKHCLYVPLICEILSHAGQHAIHSAAVALGPGDAKAILLAGPSGRGKTTTALALAGTPADPGRNGGEMKLIADDTCFLTCRPQEKKLKVWGLRRDCRVRPKTLDLLPWLGELPRKASPAGEVDLVEVAGLQASGGALAEPTDILLLERPNADCHRVWPVDKIVACEELLRQNVHATDSVGDSPGADAMRAITKLVGQCRTWRISAGPNLASLRSNLESVLHLEESRAGGRA